MLLKEHLAAKQYPAPDTAAESILAHVTAIIRLARRQGFLEGWDQCADHVALTAVMDVTYEDDYVGANCTTQYANPSELERYGIVSSIEISTASILDTKNVKHAAEGKAG